MSHFKLYYLVMAAGMIRLSTVPALLRPGVLSVSFPLLDDLEGPTPLKRWVLVGSMY